jgi:hypothetical protein
MAAKARESQNQVNHKKKYHRVDNEKRAFLIELIFKQGIKIKRAAEIADVGYENAKFITKVYKKEGRNYKKSFKNVKKPRRNGTKKCDSS